MNREIKFRAWSNLEKKMIQNPPLRYSYGKWIIEYADTIMTDIILSQFTGLLDKNGKEIYFEDIVKYETWNEDLSLKEEEIIDKIQFGGGCFNLRGLPLYEYRLEHSEKIGLKIIGNIYQNSNLLKQK